MPFWQDLVRRVKEIFSRSNEPRLTFELDQGLVVTLEDLAEREERTSNEVTASLLAYAQDQRQSAQENLERWRRLTPRERQVAALTCLNYTNGQISYQLRISPETVKTYVRRVLRKLALNSKAELRHMLADWDFSRWADLP